MRALDQDLEAHLAGGATTLATCWKVTRADGAVLGFTDHDRALAFEGAVFDPAGGADGSALESSADMGVDNAEIEGALTHDALSEEDLAAGRYDGAEVEIWRVNWQDVAQRLLLKRATIGEVTREGGRFRAELRGLSQALDRTVGRVYQRECDAIFGDARCGIDATAPAFRAAGTVLAVLDDQRFLADGLGAHAAGFFAEGLLVFAGGANQGARAAVKAHDRGPAGAALSLWLPTARPIAPGDAFTITAGCDKRAATCRDRFANLVNFRGFPLMPGNDFAVSYPLKSDANDGGRR